MITITTMEAKTDAHSPQPTRYLGDLSLSAITMYEPVLFASPISTSELLGPAVLRRTRRCVIRIVRCSCSPAVWRLVPWPLGRRFASFYRFIVSLSIYRNSFGTISSHRNRTIVPKLSIRYPTLDSTCCCSCSYVSIISSIQHVMLALFSG